MCLVVKSDSVLLRHLEVGKLRLDDCRGGFGTLTFMGIIDRGITHQLWPNDGLCWYVVLTPASPDISGQPTGEHAVSVSEPDKV